VIQSKAKFTWLDLPLILILTAGCGWFLYRVNAQVSYPWNWSVIPQYLFRFDQAAAKWVPGLITQGVITTLRLSLWATILAFVCGIVMGLLRTGRSRLGRMFGWGYVELIRNIPVLVWIFIFYYFISDQLMQALQVENTLRNAPDVVRHIVSLLIAKPSQISVYLSGIVALAVYEGAYVTEIIRAGIQSVDKGQWEASAALGFSRMQQMRHVVFPQALRTILPPLAGQFISTIKDSAIVSVISIQELTFQGMELMAATFIHLKSG